MKKIYTILMGSLMSLLSFAGNGYNDSKLSVTYAGTDNIKISVDGYDYNNADNAVMVENLQPGYHTIKVYKDKRRGWNIFGGRRDRDQTLYSNSVYIKPRTFVDIMINRFGRALVDEQSLDNNGGWNDNNDDNDHNHGGGYGNGNNGNGGGYGNGNNGNNGNGNNGGWNNGYGNVMNDRDFSAAKEQIRKEWFENTRITIAKQVIDGSSFTTAQVKELMYLFTFENNRLEIAKYAYRRTVDKQNYYQLNDALTFNSSKEELARFIRESH
jgi:hypothetical protein